MDSFGRQIDYLRISVTDRCNERCLYCMPEGYHGWQPKAVHLTAGEIVRVVRVAAGLGFRKFRLTGGEPLVRPDLLEIVRQIAALPGVARVGLSTNGTRLARWAAPLREAGLRTVNISLDALDREVYRRITGGDLTRALQGIEAALDAGYECIKLNCVLMRHVNEGEIWPLIHFAADRRLPLRLIELMPLTTREVLTPENFLPVSEVRQLLEQKDTLVPLPRHDWGWGPAKYYRLKKTGAQVGFIGAMTQPHFCETCNKMRLTSDGKIRPCLGDDGELDLQSLLRGGASDEVLRGLLQTAMRTKPEAHQFQGQYQPCRPMTALGG